jgi:hypothetical protein
MDGGAGCPTSACWAESWDSVNWPRHKGGKHASSRAAWLDGGG